MPVITLPDGSQRHFDHPVTVDEVAGSIGAGLRKAALAARLNGKLVPEITRSGPCAQTRGGKGFETIAGALPPR